MGIIPNGTNKGLPVHLRQGPIEQHDIVRMRSIPFTPKDFQRLSSTGRNTVDNLQCSKLTLQNHSTDVMPVHNQNTRLWRNLFNGLAAGQLNPRQA